MESGGISLTYLPPRLPKIQPGARPPRASCCMCHTPPIRFGRSLPFPPPSPHHPLVLGGSLMRIIEPLESRIAPAAIYALDNNGALLVFDSESPGSVDTITITGLGANQTLR